MIFCANPLAREHTQVLASLVALGVTFVAIWFYKKSDDPYGSFHLKLNLLPGETEAKTEWLNMGYWKDTSLFPHACEALALKVIGAAGCKVGGSVLDVGHGSGDSLLLQLQHPLIPRPSLLVGVTSLEEHYARSEMRLSLEPDSPSQVHLLHSDAISRTSDLKHPLSESSRYPQFTSIIAIDCAYHFNTRENFLRQCLERLAPGGRVALADICFSSGPNYWLPLVAGIPKENMITPAQYVRMLEEIGYEDVQMEDISEEVFPGFSKFLESRGRLWRFFAVVIQYIASRGARFVVVSAQKPEDNMN